jgi:hypothetical protein
MSAFCTSRSEAFLVHPDGGHDVPDEQEIDDETRPVLGPDGVLAQLFGERERDVCRLRVGVQRGHDFDQLHHRNW